MFLSDCEHTRSPGNPGGANFGRGGAGTLLGARGQAWETRVPRAAHSPRTQSSDMAEARADQPPPHLSRARRRAAPSFLSAGAAPPPAVRLAGPAAPHGPRRRPRSPLPRSRPGSHCRSEPERELRLRRQTGDWARPRGAMAARRERPELPPVTPAGDPSEGLGRLNPRGHAPRPIGWRPVCRPRPSGARRFEVPFIFLMQQIENSSAH